MMNHRSLLVAVLLVVPTWSFAPTKLPRGRVIDQTVSFSALHSTTTPDDMPSKNKDPSKDPLDTSPLSDPQVQELGIKVALVSVAGLVIYAIGTTLVSGASDLAASLAQATGDEIVREGSVLFGHFWNVVLAVGGWLLQVAPVLVKACWEALQVALPFLGQVLHTVADTTAPFVQDVSEQVSEAAAPYVQDASQHVSEAIRPYVAPVVDAAVSQVQSVQSTIDATADAVTNTVQSTIDGATESVSKTVESAAGSILEWDPAKP